jgi:short-subunit dehydrogenase
MAVVLITGGSSGIGFELARVFSKREYHIIINGANETRLAAAKDRLEKEFGRTVDAFVQDLSQSGGAKTLYEQIRQASHQVDILINNAGMGLLAPTEEIDFEADEVLMRLNIIALVQLCKLYLLEMYRRGNGKILNIGSVAAFQPGPYNSTYFASKSFVLSYSRAIRFEAKDRGVQVCTLCPGTTKTQFFDKEGLQTPVMADDPEKVAEFAYRKLASNTEVMIPGLFNKLSRLMPTGLRMRLVALMRNLPKK